MLKIKITACENKMAWYKNSIGDDIDCLWITDEGTAIIDANTVNEIDGGTDGACGHVTAGEFTIVQDDNR